MHTTLPSRRTFLATAGAVILGARSLPRWRTVTVRGLGGVGSAAGIGLRSAVVPYEVLTDPRANIMVPKAVNDALVTVAPSAINPHVEDRGHSLTLCASLPDRTHGRIWRPHLVRHAFAECEGVEMHTIVVNGRLAARQALVMLAREEA